MMPPWSWEAAPERRKREGWLGFRVRPRPRTRASYSGVCTGEEGLAWQRWRGKQKMKGEMAGLSGTTADKRMGAEAMASFRMADDLACMSQ